MALTDEDKDILRKAAEEILRRGIWQGAGGNFEKSPEECEVCALGAIAAAGGDTPSGWFYVYYNHGDIVRALAKALPECSFHAHPEERIINWNDDHSGRTAEEVAELFLSVADNF